MPVPTPPPTPAPLGPPGHQGRQERPVGPDAAGAHPSDTTARLPLATGLPHPEGGRPFEDGPSTRAAAPADFPDFPDSPAGAAGSADSGGNPSRRRRFVLVGAGATAVVMAAAGFAGGLFSYESPSRNGAAPDGIRASVPDASVDEPSPSGSEPASAPSSASPPESAGESASPSASKEPESASATPSPTASPTQEPSAANSASASQQPSAVPEKADPVILRRGDAGPEVAELQLRLRQLAFYVGGTDGTYDNRTENAVRNYQFTRGINGEQGTYGPQTRQRLESETKEP